MNVSLTSELEQFVNDKVESGMYYSASEVIREGLRLLKEQDALRQMRFEQLRKERKLLLALNRLTWGSLWMEKSFLGN